MNVSNTTANNTCALCAEYALHRPSTLVSIRRGTYAWPYVVNHVNVDITSPIMMRHSTKTESNNRKDTPELIFRDEQLSRGLRNQGTILL
jgi:hypothetical protein